MGWSRVVDVEVADRQMPRPKASSRRYIKTLHRLLLTLPTIIDRASRVLKAH